MIHFTQCVWVRCYIYIHVQRVFSTILLEVSFCDVCSVMKYGGEWCVHTICDIFCFSLIRMLKSCSMFYAISVISRRFQSQYFLMYLIDVRVIRSLVVCVCFVDRCFFLLSFFFWPLCCLFFLGLRILITPLVSSNSSSDSVVLFGFFSLILLTYSLLVACGIQLVSSNSSVMLHSVFHFFVGTIYP